MNSVCRKGRCTCPTNFEEFNIDPEKRICRLAPSKIGDTCQRDCKPPLLCRDGRCECYGGSIINNECVVPCPVGQQLYGVECTRVAKYGQTCTEDRHCIDPFNACIAGTCQCSPGTTRDLMKGICYAVCPDGMHPRQSCRRLFINDVDMLESAANTDSCPLGYRCVTYGSPYVGHCCRLRCPYGEPDLSQSCDVGAPMDSKCRPLTHFCYTITEPGWKSSLCCPRPCRDPTPLYINGQCHSIAHRDDPCHLDEQCEGGVTMGCVLGTCKCKLGYQAFSVDDRGARLVVFLFGDPHLLEGRKGGEYGSADPDGVFPLRRSNDLDLHRAEGRDKLLPFLFFSNCEPGRKGSDFLLHSVGDSRVHRGSSREDGVGVQVFTDIDVALHDRVVGRLMDASGFHAQEGWLKQKIEFLPVVDQNTWKRASGQRNRSLPTVMTWPSGNSYDFSKEDDDAAVAISCSKSRAT
ncbi:hypothetical protein WR25_12714 [Diploscapter pachys]|uniref:EB domain-containing protein n=1 Tax=Diploscapter pachys TaxID=2018661 RepID=A0A2A2LLK3_9BILA|nr:hypothetical protein WR25_12714 [Diploscapter pachys]